MTISYLNLQISEQQRNHLSAAYTGPVCRQRDSISPSIHEETNNLTRGVGSKSDGRIRDTPISDAGNLGIFPDEVIIMASTLFMFVIKHDVLIGAYDCEISVGFRFRSSLFVLISDFHRLLPFVRRMRVRHQSFTNSKIE